MFIDKAEKIIIIIFSSFLILRILFSWIKRIISELKIKYYTKYPTKFLSKSFRNQKLFIIEIEVSFDGRPEKIFILEEFIDYIEEYKLRNRLYKKRNWYDGKI